MYRLILLLMCMPLFSHELQIAYFDKHKYEENSITPGSVFTEN